MNTDGNLYAIDRMMEQAEEHDERAALEERLEAARRDAKEAEAYAEALEAKRQEAFQMYVDANEARLDAEAKLAQQDDLVQAAVAAALREALAEIANLGAEFQAGGSPTAVKVLNLAAGRILALITPDAQAALDRVVAAERERCAKMAEGETAGPYFRLPAFHGSDGCASDESEVAQAARAIAAAIRKGGE